MLDKKVSVREFEETVWEKEGVKLYIQAPEKTKVQDYNYRRKTKGTDSITAWKKKRLLALEGREYIIVDGAHDVPNGKTSMKNLRSSYSL